MASEVVMMVTLKFAWWFWAIKAIGIPLLRFAIWAHLISEEKACGVISHWVSRAVSTSMAK